MVTDTVVTTTTTTTTLEEKYKVLAPESMQETFMSDSEDEGGEIININVVQLQPTSEYFEIFCVSRILCKKSACPLK